MNDTDLCESCHKEYNIEELDEDGICVECLERGEIMSELYLDPQLPMEE